MPGWRSESCLTAGGWIVCSSEHYVHTEYGFGVVCAYRFGSLECIFWNREMHPTFGSNCTCRVGVEIVLLCRGLEQHTKNPP